jgi:hypothetical protein
VDFGRLKKHAVLGTGHELEHWVHGLRLEPSRSLILSGNAMRLVITTQS